MHTTVYIFYFPIKNDKVRCKKLNNILAHSTVYILRELLFITGCKLMVCIKLFVQNTFYLTQCLLSTIFPSYFGKFCPFTFFHHLQEIVFSIYWFRSWAVVQVGPFSLCDTQ